MLGSLRKTAICESVKYVNQCPSVGSILATHVLPLMTLLLTESGSRD